YRSYLLSQNTKLQKQLVNENPNKVADSSQKQQTESEIGSQQISSKVIQQKQEQPRETKQTVIPDRSHYQTK
ncbi:Hypothetical protein CINCED_3A022081, partial [Cinara cedri]